MDQSYLRRKMKKDRQLNGTYSGPCNSNYWEDGNDILGVLMHTNALDRH